MPAVRGIDVLLTIVLRLGTNETLDLCLRAISAVARQKNAHAMTTVLLTDDQVRVIRIARPGDLERNRD